MTSRGHLKIIVTPKTPNQCRCFWLLESLKLVCINNLEGVSEEEKKIQCVCVKKQNIKLHLGKYFFKHTFINCT